MTKKVKKKTAKTKKVRKSPGGVKKGLTQKEKLFIETYFINGFNGKQAAIKAGYAPHSAAVTASKLLTKSNVSKEVQRRLTKLNERAEAKADRVIQEIESIAHSDIKDIMERNKTGELKLRDLDKIPSQLIESITPTKYGYKVKLWSKTAALDQLMRYHKLYNDAANNSVEVDFIFKVKQPEKGDRAETRKAAAIKKLDENQ
jgi:phage terminase small subunit